MIGETFKDVLRYVPSRLIPAFVAFVTVPILTHLLPPAEYGRYTLALSAAALFTTLTSAWISSSAIRFVPTYERDGALNRGLGVLLVVFLVSLALNMAAMGALATVFAIRYLLPMSLVLVALLLCVTSASQEFLLGLLRSRRRVTTFTFLASASGIAGYVLAIAIAATFGPSARSVVLGLVVGGLLVLPFSVRSSLAGVAVEFSDLKAAQTREVLRYGLPALIINALTWVMVLSDRYVLGATQGEHVVGIYAVSRDLSDKVLMLFNTLVLLASTPLGVAVWEKQGVDAARRYVTQLTRYYLMLALPLAVGMGVLARPLIGTLADPRYHDGYRLVPFVAAGSVLAGLATRYTLGLTFRKRTDLLSGCYLGAGLLNVLLNVILVPRYGFMAAAVVNVITFGTLLLLVQLVARSHFTWSFPRSALMRIGAATVVMGSVVWLTSNAIKSDLGQLAAGIPLGIITYSIVLLVLGEIGPQERAALVRHFGLKQDRA